MHVVDWSVKEFTFAFRSIDVVFAIHDLEVIAEPALNLFSLIFVSGIWVNRLASFPIVLGLFIEETVITGTIRRRFVNVLDVICVLMRSASLVEVLLILSVVVLIVLTISHISSVVPCWNPAISRLVNTLLKSVHFL